MSLGHQTSTQAKFPQAVLSHFISNRTAFRQRAPNIPTFLFILMGCLWYGIIQNGAFILSNEEVFVHLERGHTVLFCWINYSSLQPTCGQLGNVRSWVTSDKISTSLPWICDGWYCACARPAISAQWEKANEIYAKYALQAAMRNYACLVRILF